MIRTFAKPVLAAAAVAALLAACSQQQTDKTADDAGAAVNAAQDATSTAVGQTSAATMGANTVGGFVNGLAVSDMYELEAAKIAATRSTSADVKALAAMITKDHTASTAKLKELAPTAAPTVALPMALDERHKGLIDNLNAASPADFDKVWLNQQAAAHDEALTMLNGFDDNTEAPTLAALATEIIPKVTAHRDHAKALLDAMH
jgi:putative membrane protein